MKAAESKTTTTAQHLQPKAESQEPFFQKERTDSVLEQGNTPFFSPQAQSQPFFSKPSIQTKLTVGQPGDKYEQEADQMADQVVQRLAEPDQSGAVGLSGNGQMGKTIQRKPIFDSNAEPTIQAKFQTSSAPTTPLIQAKCDDCEQEEKLQKKEEPGLEEQVQMKPIFESNAEPPETPLQAKLEHTPFLQKQCAECAAEEETPGLQKQADSAASPAATPSLESRLSSSRGGGSPLPENTRSQMEGAFGSDFSGVRVHTDSSAVQMNKELGAQAFTHGSDVYFNAGKYDDGSTEGKKLLGHELTHVVQQGVGTSIQRKTEKPETTSEDILNNESTTKENGTASQKNNQESNSTAQNTVTNLNTITDSLTSTKNNKQSNQLDEQTKELPQNIKGILNQDQIAPIDKHPEKSQLTKKEESSKKNMQSSLGKTAQKQGGKSHKKGKTKANKNKQIKSTIGGNQLKSTKDSLGASTINVVNDLPKIPHPASAGSKQLLTKINESFLQLQQQFLYDYAQKKENLSSLVTSRQQDIIATGIGMGAQITHAIATARATITNNIAASQAQISSYRLNQDNVLTGSENSSTTNVATIFTASQTAITNNATAFANQSVQTANNSANQLQTNVTQSVNQAHNIGEQKANVSDSNTGVRKAKQRTAREIAADTANKIAGGRTDAEEKIRGTGPMASQEFQKQGREAASQLILGKAQVDSELMNIFSNAKVGIQSIEQTSNQSLFQIQGQFLEQLADLETKLLQQLRKEIDKKIADLQKAGQQTLSLFDKQAQNALTKSRTQLVNNNNQIANTKISEQKVDEAHSLIVDEMSGGFNALQSTFENSAQEATNQLVQQDTELEAKLSNTQTVILSQIDTFSSNARTQIDQSKSNSITQLTEATGQAVSGSNQTISQVETNIFQQVQTINQNFSSGFIDFEGNLATQVNEATREAQLPLGDLNFRIDEGQARAAVRAERSWLSNQFHDAVEMLSSPGFWAGLVVGLLLTIVFVLLIAGTALTGGALLAVLVVGFAVIGGVAAAVGSVVNQATRGSFSGGWDWSRVNWGQVGRAALFGAAAGAVFAAVAFFAVEVFGVAVASWTFVGIMSVTAGVVTIVTNLINGQPWDKDLLINMTIAGFFAWLARFFPGGRGRPTVIRAGQRIVIRDPSRLSYTRPVLEGGYWKWNLMDTETGAIFTHYVKATSATGPDMYIDPGNAHIPGVGKVQLVAEGFNWTTEGNRLNMQAYEEIFGTRPPNLSGQLWRSNLDRFVVAYDQIRNQNPGSSQQDIANAAIRETSFGRGKIEQGYGNLRVVMDGVEFGDITINGRTYNNVPRNDVAIDVIAEPTTN